MAKVKLIVGDPKKPAPDNNMVLSPTKPQLDLDFDLRDRLSELVTKGNSLSADDKAAIYGNLSTMLGKEKAQKIMNHAYIFNTRPEIQKLPLEDRLKSFYTIGSNDPEVLEVMGRTKRLGYGVAPGYRESISDLNQATRGAVMPTSTTSIDPELTKKIMVRVNK
jgi:hypothetical protein